MEYQLLTKKFSGSVHTSWLEFQNIWEPSANRVSYCGSTKISYNFKKMVQYVWRMKKKSQVFMNLVRNSTCMKSFVQDTLFSNWSNDKKNAEIMISVEKIWEVLGMHHMILLGLSCQKKKTWYFSNHHPFEILHQVYTTSLMENRVVEPAHQWLLMYSLVPPKDYFNYTFVSYQVPSNFPRSLLAPPI